MTAIHLATMLSIILFILLGLILHLFRMLQNRQLWQADRMRKLERAVLEKDAENGSLATELHLLRNTVGRLHNAIRMHHDARGHDSCWINDLELYQKAGFEAPQRNLPPMREFLGSCIKYYQDQRAGCDQLANLKCPWSQNDDVKPCDAGEPCPNQAAGSSASGEVGERPAQLSSQERDPAGPPS